MPAILDLPLPAALEFAEWALANLSYRQQEWLKAALAIAGLLALAGAAIYGAIRLNRWLRRLAEQRTREIQVILEPSLTLSEADPAIHVAMLRQCVTFRKQNVSVISNRFAEPFQEGRRLQVMDAAYLVTTGKGIRTVWQTVAHIGDRHWNLPSFSITPRGFWSRLPLPFPRRGIRFAMQPKFDALFKVECDDEAITRAILTPSLLEALVWFPGLSVEGCGNDLVLFRRKKLLKPADYPNFLDGARKLGALFPLSDRIPPSPEFRTSPP